jgi:hypothetical protein
LRAVLFAAIEQKTGRDLFGSTEMERDLNDTIGKV